MADHADPFQGMPVGDAGMGCPRTIPEMNALREWEDRHERELEETDAKEKAGMRERRQAAQEELQSWYADVGAAAQKRQASNRSDEAAALASRAEAMKPTANPWELVAGLIDTTAQAGGEGGRDTSRMRSLLLQLKASPAMTAPQRRSAAAERKKAKCILLTHSDTNQGTLQTVDKVQGILQSKFKIDLEVVDGRDSPDKLDAMVRVSREKGVYPQLFHESGNQYTYVGNGENVLEWNEISAHVKDNMGGYASPDVQGNAAVKEMCIEYRFAESMPPPM